MPRAIIYLRVSTEVQSRSGVGLEEQLASAQRCLAGLQNRIPDLELSTVTPEGKHLHELTRPGVFIDGAVSARTTNMLERPVGRQLLLHLEDGDVLIVAHQNRAFRQSRDFCNSYHLINRKGIKMVFADKPELDGTTAVGMLQLNTMAAYDQFFSDANSEKMRGVHDLRRAHPYLARNLRKTSRDAWKNKGVYACCPKRADAVLIRYIITCILRGDSRLTIARRLIPIFNRRWAWNLDLDRLPHVHRMRAKLDDMIDNRWETILMHAHRYRWFNGSGRAIKHTIELVQDYKANRSKRPYRGRIRFDENGDVVLSARERRYVEFKRKQKQGA